MNLQENHPLSRYCTFQIGGPADFFVAAESVDEVLEALAWAEERNLPVYVFGAGSNLLFDDAGFRGLVIRMRAKDLQVIGEEIQADAGVMASQLVKAAADAGLTGLEAWNGLPGTVGGAVYGNAGCFGVETKDVLLSADLYFPGEGLCTWRVKDFKYKYRWSALKEKNGVVLRAYFQLKKGDPELITAAMNDVARLRIKKQPPGLSTGSFFKNPSPEQPAGWLIDQCGLKGKRLGGAQISEHHANFFLNAGGASAKDILDLEELVRTTVRERFGIELEREIVFVPAEKGV